ncbi:MAG: CHASE2 domain-containing protein [Proteobacteria bacterium]|jgi:signal transduction histidine kinase|nr:CHASE2 domain-containing protein [Pseudomonadota bacterium]
MKWTGFWTLILRRKGVLFRGLLCWSLGVVLLSGDERTSYDLRFQLRGDQPIVQDRIVLINLRPSDFEGLYTQRANLWTLKEITDLTDSFYWHQKTWFELLKHLLSKDPSEIGVSFFFSESLGPLTLTEEEHKVFFDPRIVWAANANAPDRTNDPLFTNDIRSNIGNNDLVRDEDGIIRRFAPTPSETPHLIEKLLHRKMSSSGPFFLNFRGRNDRFQEIQFSDIMENRIPSSYLKGKIVLIGSDSSSSTYSSPLGSTYRNEVLATVLDNQIANRWIVKLPQWVYALGLLALLLASLSIMTQYPQSVSFVALFWLGTSVAAVSAWVFDTHYIWIPVFSPTVQLIATWVIFTGYQANKIERKNWELQQEQIYLSELEQLKNNFVSLISHDLKTPIAKIQAIVDRLLAQDQIPELQKDLKSLRHSSEELNKYIQSILKLLRVESRDFKLNKEIGDINEIVEEAIEQLRPLAAEKNISIKAHLEPMFSSEFDSTLLREVFINVIENAIKYSDPSASPIQIFSKEVDEFIVIEILDSGEGISPEELSSVFGKFVRGRDQDMKSKGSGLGLYLVKYFIELHQGQVELSSEKRKGTKVTIKLPIVDESESLTQESV